MISGLERAQQPERGRNNRIPTTLVVCVPLTMTKQTVQAMWHNVRGSTVILDSPSTLSAIY